MKLNIGIFMAISLFYSHTHGMDIQKSDLDNHKTVIAKTKTTLANKFNDLYQLSYVLDHKIVELKAANAPCADLVKYQQQVLSKGLDLITQRYTTDFNHVLMIIEREGSTRQDKEKAGQLMVETSAQISQIILSIKQAGVKLLNLNPHDYGLEDATDLIKRKQRLALLAKKIESERG